MEFYVFLIDRFLLVFTVPIRSLSSIFFYCFNLASLLYEEKKLLLFNYGAFKENLTDIFKTQSLTCPQGLVNSIVEESCNQIIIYILILISTSCA